MTLLYLAIAFVVGIAAGSALTGHVLRPGGLLGCAAPAWLFPSLAILCVAGILMLRAFPKARLTAACLLFLVLGAWRYTADPFQRCWTTRDLAYYQSDDGVWATLEGTVAGFPDVLDAGAHYELAVESVTIQGVTRPVQGRVMVEASRNPVYAYGDTLRVTGLLLEPPVSNDFDYRRFLATRGIHSLVRRPRIEHLSSGGGQPFWRALYAVRSAGAAIVNRIMPEPAAALTNGMVLGIEGGISRAVKDDFKATGTSHLIVISGSNIAFLAGALVAALGRILSRRRATLVAAPFILVYVLLVGADPPALRAGVMGLLGLGAVFFGRRGTAYVSLCAAGLIMLALDPLTLWDIGFQLSFMTSLGLILFSRPLGSALLAFLRLRLPIAPARRLTNLLDGTLIVTVAAQAAVLPLLLAYFGRLSPVSLLANCLVLPVQPAILAGGIASLLAGAAWQPFGQLLATLPWLLLTYTVRVVTAAASLPYASVDVGRISPLFVAGYYALLIVAFCYPRLARLLRARGIGGHELRRAAVWSTLLLVPLCFSLFAWRAQPDGRLHVVFIPGKGGEAAVIVAPDGRTVWAWDGRGDGMEWVAATERSGWLSGRPDLVLADCAANPWQAGPCLDPASLAYGAGVAVTADLHLTRVSSNAAPALLLTYGQFTTLLPSTLPPAAQPAVQLPQPVVLLKAAGPDTGAWPTVDYLSATRPQVILWPLETTYPPDVADYLAAQTTTARVDPQAVVEIISDGSNFWLVRHSSEDPR